MKKYNIINNSLGWLCFVIAAVTYLLTLEPTASFWDCPEFISQGAKLDVGHPPGNPIFMLTARFFVTIFGGGIEKAAIAVNSMSAIFSAATILLLFWTITALVKRIMVRDGEQEISLPKMIVIMGSGLCGALAYTWSDTFWFSAVEAEVYAFSSFCTALVFWLILKWQPRADEPHSDRYLVLIAYVIGVSIAVHLLNLLCIPAIVLVFYFTKHRDANAKGSLIALGVSFVLVAAILYGLVPGFIKVAQGFELFFVNVFQAPYNVGVLFYAIVLLGALIFTTWLLYQNDGRIDNKKDGRYWLTRFMLMACAMLSGLTFFTSNTGVWVILFALAACALILVKKLPTRVLTVSVLSILVIFIGYSSYALLLIRASANTPMNQNAPDNVFSLSSYLNREQYGQTPLLYGPVFAEELTLQAYDYGNEPILLVVFDENGQPQTRIADGIMRTKDGRAIDTGHKNWVKVVKTSPNEPDKYVQAGWTPDYQTPPELNMVFTRMYSTDPQHVKGYKAWSGYTNSDLYNFRDRVSEAALDKWENQGYAISYEVMKYFPNIETVYTDHEHTFEGAQYIWKPSFADNLRYFFNYQLIHMYWRYFMWNFAGRQNDIQGNGEPHLGNWISGIPVIDNARLGDQSLIPEEFTTGNKGHNVFFMLPLLLGLLGLIWQSLMRHKYHDERGIQQFWVVFFLFFMTGVAIVLYLNQTPGQPRERDYAFAGSFYAFAIWIGMGVAAIYRIIMNFVEPDSAPATPRPSDSKTDKPATSRNVAKASLVAACVAAAVGLIVPLQMVSQTWDDHDRSNRYTARDFGQNYLNSLEENAIIFTNGDNDTFPLWYAQEVEGIRTDVRVVNLSYLSTDWYANQLIHPYYDAAPVPMLANPSVWGYDEFSYSFANPGSPTKDEPTPALEALGMFYHAPANTVYSARGIHLLDNPSIYMPIDTAAVISRFGIDMNAPEDESLVPYIAPITTNALNGGFGLSKLLSLDIIANSVDSNFERPIYFASTVPSSYYLNLQPYMYSTGMADQVIPFEYAPYSPVVEKAYENIVSKYLWGGLDNPKTNSGLYLDETVRRMVSSTRNSILDIAEILVDTGDMAPSEFAVSHAKEAGNAVPQNRYDMARTLLNLMEEKLPENVARYESMTDMPLILLYLRLYNASGNTDDLARAESLIDLSLERYSQLVRYAASLSASRLQALGNTETFALRYVPFLIGLKNYVALHKALGSNPENKDLLDLITSQLGIENASYVYHLLYLEDADPNMLYDFADSYGEIVDRAINIAEAHELAGLDQMEITNQVLRDYGLNLRDLKRLNIVY